MRSLRTIEMLGALPSMIDHLLRTIVAPVLEVLYIHVDDFDYGNDAPTPGVAEPLSMFLTTSGQTLRRVSWSAIDLPWDDLAPILQKTPLVSYLRLTRMESAHGVLETLATEKLCLQLDSLVLDDIDSGHSNNLSIPLRKLARQDDRTPLQRLVIRECGVFDSEDLAWLSAEVPSFKFITTL